MRTNDGKFNNINPIKPPQGLFSRIIKRLGLEKQLIIVKRNLGFFSGLLAVFIFLSIFAYIGLKQVLTESAFGPYLSLILSDPRIVLKNWQSFMLSVFESMPSIIISVFLVAVAFLLIFIKMTIIFLNKFSSLKKSINKQQYGHK